MRYGLYAPQITVQDLLTKATSYLLVKLTERLIISVNRASQDHATLDDAIGAWP